MADEMTQTVTAPPPGDPPPFKSAVEDLAKPLDDAAVRNAVMAAEAAGEDVVSIGNGGTPLPVGMTNTRPSLLPQTPPVTPTPAPARTPETTQRFMKPDGTVDVEKLKASSEQLDQALQQKQEGLQQVPLTPEQMLTAYKEKERLYRSLPNPEKIANAAGVQPVVQPPQPPVQAPIPNAMPPATVSPEQYRAQIQADLQANPVDTIIDLIKAVTLNSNEPLLKIARDIEENKKDDATRRNLAQIATEDPRIGQYYQEVLKVFDEEPAFLNAKNPHRAAWNEVKARMRLGELNQPTQPSRTASPILGGGTPPPVPSTQQSLNPSNLHQAMKQARTSQDLAAVEVEMRKIADQVFG
jgi:ribosomal protein S15P/S13E